MDAATICAIATPAGPGERAVVRLSGPACRDIVLACVRFDGGGLGARGLRRGRLIDLRGEQPVEVWWMPAPHSYTREDVAELHVPGAAPLVQATLERLLAAGARLAEPGEFTRRAFLSGRLDLAQAEGVLELTRAASEAERRAGLGLLAGGLGERTRALRSAVEELRALTEASLDFDETDTGHVPTAELAELAAHALESCAQALAWEVRREPTAGLARVLLVGEPNAGKSSLFNALIPAGRALTSDFAGTTRDWLAGRWALAGGDVVLVDTPGLEALREGPDALAQELARREREAADLFLWVVSAASGVSRLPAELEPADDRDGAFPPVVLVWSQIDRPDARPTPPPELLVQRRCVATSVRTRAGLAELARSVEEALAREPTPADPGTPDRVQSTSPGEPGEPGTGEAGGVGRAITVRHQRALAGAHLELERACAGLAQGLPLDLVAESLRAACDELDRIAGRTLTEGLLDRIFARFCLGK